MSAPITLSQLRQLEPIRVQCGCGTVRTVKIDAFKADMTTAAFLRALRCTWCNQRGGKTLIATFDTERPPPKPPLPDGVVSLFWPSDEYRKPRRKTSMMERGFAEADRRRLDTIKALYPDIEKQIADEDHWQRVGKLARALIGWSNDAEG